MDLIEIRLSLEWYTQTGARPPSAEEWSELLEAWGRIKPDVHPDYHPIIDDRIALVESRSRAASPDQGE